jgi:hypothetical protein
MKVIIEKITIYSDNGDKLYPCEIEIKMDGSKPDCPITLMKDKKPLFSMGSDEVDEFCKALKAMA